ncbi:hypothetical protein BH20VER1_BH20VER1_19310 [soil metagenome]
MKTRGNPDSEPNIRRIDSKRNAQKQTHGFQVHFLRGNQAVTRMFSDTIYGGKEGARRAARKYKREMLGELPERIFRGPVAASKAAASKKSGTKSRAAGAAARQKTSRRR